MYSPPLHAHATTIRMLSPFLLLGATALALLVLVIQPNADAAAGPTPGIGVKRWGSTYSTASGYDRYAYVNVAPGDAAAAGALATKSLVYMSGTSVQTSWSTGVSYQEALANNWLLKDASGQYLMNVAYGAYVGDFGNAAYQQRFVDNVASLLSRNGNEGVFIDDVIASPEGLTGGKYPTKYPTQQAWEDAQVAFVQSVSQALRGRGYYVLIQAIKFISGDPGSNDGSLNAQFWGRLAPYPSGIQSEYWMQDPNTVTRLRASGSQWYQQWDAWANLANIAQNGGADFFAMMYGGSSNVDIMRYGKASFLLMWDGSGGAFTYDLSSGDPWNAEWTTDIGQPSGSRYQVGVGWRRQYTGGTVILNPSPSSSQTFSLGATYARADGSNVTSVTLAPTTALVLKSTSAAPPPAAPANTTPPAISGTPQEGLALTTSTGTWTSSPTSYTFQWKRCDSSGANCASIAGATSAQYVLASSDVGKTLRASVTASNTTGSTSATSSATAAVAPAPATAAPTNTTPPAISGTPQEGLALTTSTGSWTNSPTAYVFQWKRCDSSGANCASIAGATSAQYVLASSDVGKTLRASVTASNDLGPAVATSPPTNVVVPSSNTISSPANTALPGISGTPQEGLALTTSTGTWTNSPTSYTFQWKRCDSSGANCASIAGATSARYVLASSDVGKTLRASVTASNTTGSTSATSSATAAVAPAPAPQPGPAPTALPGNTALPAISGTPQEGLALTTSTGTWTNSPTSYTFQWKRCDSSGANCASIAGATSARYVLVSSDVGKTLRASVTASNTTGSTSATSSATAAVAPAPAPPAPTAQPVSLTAPSIMGPRIVGKDVRSSVGDWSIAPTRFTYQWQRCRESSSGCEIIQGATQSTYTPTTADVDFYLVVVVTAWNGADSASAASTEKPNDNKRIRG
jgi:threonine/homoserine efflux transporter RhtA